MLRVILFFRSSSFGVVFQFYLKLVLLEMSIYGSQYQCLLVSRSIWKYIILCLETKTKHEYQVFNINSLQNKLPKYVILQKTDNYKCQFIGHMISYFISWNKRQNKLGQHQSQTPFSCAFWVQESVGSKQILGAKYFLVKNNFVCKSFVSKKCWVQKKF